MRETAPRPHVLIAGVSTRAMADSAARAGFSTTAIDAFGDLDQHESVRGFKVAGDYSSLAAARFSREIRCDAVAYAAGFENHPDAIQVLSEGRALWGNPPAEVRRVRDPFLLEAAFRRRGLAAPRVSRDSSVSGIWLLKPTHAGGGHLVRAWTSGSRSLPAGTYLQERIDGDPMSVVFVANGREAVPLGVTRQLIGRREFGASGFQYCGSIIVRPTPDLRVRAHALATAVTEDFNLIGVNGIDFVCRNTVPYPVEVNPRWCASMELMASDQRPLFALHAAACETGALPKAGTFPEVAHTRGKAVVFAGSDVRFGHRSDWLEAGSGIRDIPPPGTAILARRPVCTIFADGPDPESCCAALIERSGRVLSQLDTWANGIL